MIIEQLKESVDSIKPLVSSYKSAIGEDKLTSEQFERLKKAVSNDNIIFFVAKSENEIVAMCSVTKTFSTFSCNYSGVFEDFYIAPKYRKNGLARKMTDFVFNYCQRNDIFSLWVGCADCDTKMYQHLGFETPLGNLLTWSAK